LHDDSHSREGASAAAGPGFDGRTRSRPAAGTPVSTSETADSCTSVIRAYRFPATRHTAVVYVNPLRSFDLPDVGDHLIHFTGREGRRVEEVPDTITSQSATDRLFSILWEGVIRAYPQFGGTLPTSCFTESVASSILHLILVGRYTPHGVGFSKQFVWNQGGGPVSYMRGDRWWSIRHSLSPEIRSMTVRYWPGATSATTDQLPSALRDPSEWLHEREWRVLGDTEFAAGDPAFVLVDEGGIVASLAQQLELVGASEAAAYWQRVPEIVIDTNGDVVSDPVGIFS
jgi:hypothetical protein